MIAGLLRAAAGGVCGVLSPTFRAGEMVLFIPWRVVAEDCAAHLDLPWLAGGAVAGFLFSDIPVRGDDGARAIGATDDAAAVELPGRRRRHPGSKAALEGSAAS